MNHFRQVLGTSFQAAAPRRLYAAHTTCVLHLQCTRLKQYLQGSSAHIQPLRQNRVWVPKFYPTCQRCENQKLELLQRLRLAKSLASTECRHLSSSSGLPTPLFA